MRRSNSQPCQGQRIISPCRVIAVLAGLVGFDQARPACRGKAAPPWCGQRSSRAKILALDVEDHDSRPRTATSLRPPGGISSVARDDVRAPSEPVDLPRVPRADRRALLGRRARAAAPGSGRRSPSAGSRSRTAAGPGRSTRSRRAAGARVRLLHRLGGDPEVLCACSPRAAASGAAPPRGGAPNAVEPPHQRRRARRSRPRSGPP